MTRRFQIFAIIALFVIVGITIYSRVLFNGTFIFDDFEYVVNNPIIADLSSTNMSDPRQFGYFTFALNNLIGGDDPRGYHIFNVVVHIVNSLLIFFLIRAIVTCLDKGRDPDRFFSQAAFLAALIFLVHPVQTQAVSYVTQRFTSMSTLFYLLAVWLYLAARARFEIEGQTRPAYGLYVLSIVSTVLAMKTKEITFTIPFVLLMFEVLVLSYSTYHKRRFIFLLPFAATLMIIPLSIFGPDMGLVSRSPGIAEITRMEKLYDLSERSPFNYLFTQFRAVVVYIRVLLVPLGLRVVYDFPVSRSFFEARVILSFLCLAAFLGGGVYYWRKSALLKDDQETKLASRLISLGIFWFFITLSVESSVIPIKDVIFEHRVYLPSVGFYMAAAVIVMRLSYRFFCEKSVLFKVAVPVFIIALPLSVGTYVRNVIWTDEIIFWDDVVKKSPDKPIGYNNRGNAYAKKGEYVRALDDLTKTISFFPKDMESMNKWENADMTPSNMSKTYSGRGDVYIALGDNVKAREDFKRSKEIFAAPPVDVDGVLKMADQYAKRGAFKHAVDEYDKILQWDPENIRALNDRSNAYSRTKRFPEAIRDLSRVIVLDPGFVLAYHNRGIAYAWSGKNDLAMSDFKKACELGFSPACESMDVVNKGKKK